MSSTSRDSKRAALLGALALLLPLPFACSAGDLAASEDEQDVLATGEQALIALPAPRFCSIARCPAGTTCNEETRSCEPAGEAEPARCTISGAPPVQTGCEAGERCEPFACTHGIPPTCAGTCTSSGSIGSCQQLRRELVAALAEAKHCDPELNAQCGTTLPGICCPELVADPGSDAARQYLEVLKKFRAARCTSICSAVLCRFPGPGVCSELSDNSATCRSAP